MSNKKSSNKVYCLDDTDSDKDDLDVVLDVVVTARTASIIVTATAATTTTATALTASATTAATTTAIDNREVNLNDVLCGRG